MRAVVQRVIKSSVKVEGETVGEIGRGFNVLLGVTKDDTDADLKYLLEKILGLRIFRDDEGKTNLSIMDIQARDGGMGLLIISQFTLCGDVRHGKRPAFTNAAGEEYAREMYNKFVEEMKKACDAPEIKVATGIFRASMEVEIINDGPFTILLDSKKAF